MPFRTLLRRMALFLRHHGEFASARDVRALAQESAAIREQLAAITLRLDALAQSHQASHDTLTRVDAGRSALATAHDVHDVRRELQRHRRELLRVEAQLDAVVRRVHLDRASLPYPQRLTAHRFGSFSQGGEDGIILTLLDAIGQQSRRFIDIGCSDHGWNTGFLPEELGWSGLMVDRDLARIEVTRARFPQPEIAVEAITVTRDNINHLIESHQCHDADVMSIDVDGNDYWLWDALTAARPRLVVVEYNAAFGPERAVSVPYDPNRNWDDAAVEFRYTGASLRAFEFLAQRKGYRLVTCEPDGANAFFLRTDSAPEIPGLTSRQAFRSLKKLRIVGQESEAALFERIAAAGLPLVDVAD